MGGGLPDDFQGGFNFSYPLVSGEGQTLTLKVSTKIETRESLTVCTSLFGRAEPDRYAIILPLLLGVGQFF